MIFRQRQPHPSTEQTTQTNSILPKPLGKGSHLPTTVFISYCSHPQDSNLAQQLHEALNNVGHKALMVDDGTHFLDFRDFNRELSQCDYFLLLLSHHSASNQMIEAKVQLAKELREKRTNQKPVIVPIRVDFPREASMDYRMRGYLDRIQPQQDWRSRTDTPSVLQEVLYILAEQRILEMTEEALPVQAIACQKGESLASGDRQPAEPTWDQSSEFPGGTVGIASSFYAERPPVEELCCQTILQSSALIRIKAPRQMGKSSLMVRILHHADQNDCRVASLSFHIADSTIFESLDRFLRWFCASIGKQLGLPNRLNELWDADLYGSKVSCKDYFEEYLLKEIDSSVVLGLDEVDRVFEYPQIAHEFFGLLRDWHESSKTRQIWKKLRMVVTHSTEVYIPLSVNQSPFNVGLPIELPEFNAEQISYLSCLYGLNWSTEQLAQLMVMVGGHPYLVRLMMHHAKSQNLTLEQLLRDAPTHSGIYSDHLRRQAWHLQKYPELEEAFKQVVVTPHSVRLEGTAAFKLHSVGLVHLEGNEVRIRCELYRQYFSGTAQS